MLRLKNKVIKKKQREKDLSFQRRFSNSLLNATLLRTSTERTPVQRVGAGANVGLTALEATMTGVWPGPGLRGRGGGAGDSHLQQPTVPVAVAARAAAPAVSRLLSGRAGVGWVEGGVAGPCCWCAAGLLLTAAPVLWRQAVP